MTTAFDPPAAYRAFLGQLRIADPGDRVVEQAELATATARCFALREGDGVRLKACVTATGLVRGGASSGTFARGATGDDWAGLLTAAPDAATAAAWIAWLETDDTARGHGPTVPRPVEVLTAATAASRALAHAAKVRDPELTRTAAGARLIVWLAKPGIAVPLRWTIDVGATATVVTQASAVELP